MAISKKANKTVNVRSYKRAKPQGKNKTVKVRSHKRHL